MTDERPLGRQNYDDFAERYAAYAEEKPHNAHLDRPAVLSLLPEDLRGQRVLDAGAGPGFYAAALLDRGAAVVAFDVTPAMVLIARQRLGDRATVIEADLEKPLHFAQDASFDHVIAPLCLDYVRDWSQPFSEFYRVLKPGGTLVYSVGNPVADWMLVNESAGYFETELFDLPWGGFGKPKPVIRSYRRPLAAMLNPALALGFRLETVLEPRPTEAYRRVDPDGYARYHHQPTFVTFRFSRPGSG